jgi:hypothetical protein
LNETHTVAMSSRDDSNRQRQLFIHGHVTSSCLHPQCLVSRHRVCTIPRRARCIGPFPSILFPFAPLTGKEAFVRPGESRPDKMREAAPGSKVFPHVVTLCLCLSFEVLREQVLIEFYIGGGGVGLEVPTSFTLFFECLGVGCGG